MLTRNAEGLYWLGRHVERAENGCRLLGEQVAALVDRPVREINFGWRRIYGALRRRPPGPAIAVLESEDDYVLADSYTLTDDVTFERSNPDSIRCSFHNARENARQMRQCISGEMWTCLNQTWLRFAEQRIENIWKRTPESFYADLAQALGTFTGVTETTLYRDDGWWFLRLGRLIERAQFTVALLLAHIDAMRPEEATADSEWWSLLRVCQAGDAYRRWHGTGLRPAPALDLLVGDPRLPRSLCRTLDESAGTLESIEPGPGPCAEARRLVRDLAGGVHQSWPAEAGLEARVERMRRSDTECRRLHAAVMAAHVDYDPEGTAAG